MHSWYCIQTPILALVVGVGVMGNGASTLGLQVGRRESKGGCEVFDTFSQLLRRLVCRIEMQC
jgi:hypothetical protein